MSCYDRYYLGSNNNSCLQCNSPCETCFDIDKCISCINGYFLITDKCFQCNINCKTSSDDCKCDNCYDGYYLTNYQCLECDSNCQTCSVSSNYCLSCYDGYYLSSSNICEKCDSLIGNNEDIHQKIIANILKNYDPSEGKELILYCFFNKLPH